MGCWWAVADHSFTAVGQFRQLATAHQTGTYFIYFFCKALVDASHALWPKASASALMRSLPLKNRRVCSGKNREIGKVGEELISHCPPEAEVFFYSIFYPICKPCFRCESRDRAVLQGASNYCYLTQWVEPEPCRGTGILPVSSLGICILPVINIHGRQHAHPTPIDAFSHVKAFAN